MQLVFIGQHLDRAAIEVIHLVTYICNRQSGLSLDSWRLKLLAHPCISFSNIEVRELR